MGSCGGWAWLERGCSKMSSVPPAANIGNAFSPQKSFAACDDQSFPREEERVWTPRSLNQQQDGARREQSVSDSKREVHTGPVHCWSVPEQSVVVVEPGSCSQRNRQRRNRRRWSDLLLSGRSRRSAPQSVSLRSSHLGWHDPIICASQRRQEEIHQRSSEKVKCTWRGGAGRDIKWWLYKTFSLGLCHLARQLTYKDQVYLIFFNIPLWTAAVIMVYRNPYNGYSEGKYGGYSQEEYTTDYSRGPQDLRGPAAQDRYYGTQVI